MTIDLYLSVFSPYCRTVQFVAKHLGIELNLKDVEMLNGDHLKPEYIKLNPTHTIPTIDDDGFILWESRAISQYLCNKYAPDSELYPQDPQRRAVVDCILNFDIGTFSPAARQGLAVKLIHGKKPEEEKLKALKDSLTLLNTFIGDNKYVAGNQLTIADLSILAIMPIFTIGNYDLSEYPRVTEWHERLKNELLYYEELQGKVIEIMPSKLREMRSNPEQMVNFTTKM